MTYEKEDEDKEGYPDWLVILKKKGRNIEDVLERFKTNPLKKKKPKLSLEYFTDYRDGKKYKTVKIGSQVWMAENLAYSIGGVYYNDEHAYGKKYHLLYDWHSAMKACPEGWHLPSQEEWNTLIVSVGGWFVAGKKLKAKSGWGSENQKYVNGYDDFGFAALPGGFGIASRNSIEFQGAGSDGYWWSSTDVNGWYAYNNYIRLYEKRMLNEVNSKKSRLFSVRCIKN